MAVRHTKTSSKADGSDATQIQPSDWNAQHSVDAIVNADISATAEIAVSKLADGANYQYLRTDSSGNGVEWGARITTGATEPANRTAGDIWLDTSA